PSKGFPHELTPGDVPRLTTYGSSSTRFGAGMSRSPRRWPKRDTKPLSVFNMKGQKLNSFLRRMVRTNRIPHTCSAAPEKRSCEKGIRYSAVQPSESIDVATSHTGSQESSAKLPSSPKTRSCLT